MPFPTHWPLAPVIHPGLYHPKRHFPRTQYSSCSGVEAAAENQPNGRDLGLTWWLQGTTSRPEPGSWVLGRTAPLESALDRPGELGTSEALCAAASQVKCGPAASARPASTPFTEAAPSKACPLLAYWPQGRKPFQSSPVARLLLLIPLLIIIPGDVSAGLSPIEV